MLKKTDIDQDKLAKTFIETIASLTAGFSQADLDNAINESIYVKFRSKNNKEPKSWKDCITEGVDKIKSTIIKDQPHQDNSTRA